MNFSLRGLQAGTAELVVWVVRWLRLFCIGKNYHGLDLSFAKGVPLMDASNSASIKSDWMPFEDSDNSTR